MASTKIIHPSPRAQTATLPVNAPSADEAIRAIGEVLAGAGRQVMSATVTGTEPVRPFARVAVSFPSSTACYLVRVEYTVLQQLQQLQQAGA